MNYTVVIPDIGTSDQVEVIEVYIKVGDQIEIEQALVALESDKASMDIPSPHAGVVEKIQIKKGDKVSQGDLILNLITTGSEVSESRSQQEKSDMQQNMHPTATQDTGKKTATGKQNAVTKNIVIPDIGTSDQVEVIEVYVKVGDQIGIEQALVALESDKASMDIPSPHAGVVAEIQIKKGDKVAQGDLVLSLTISSSSISNGSSSGGSETQPISDIEVKNTSQITPASEQDTDNPLQNISSSGAQNNSLTVHAGPAVRKLVRELGINLNEIISHGTQGRITKEDLHNYIKQKMSQPHGGQAFHSAGVTIDEIAKFGEIKPQAMLRMQKLTAASMLRNWTNIPHITQFDEADISKLEEFRKNSKQAASVQGIKLTILPFLVKAVSLALEKFPQFNVAVGTNDQILYKKFINISVAMDTPNGLIVPVIKDTQNKSVWAIAREIAGLHGKAVDGKLKINEIQGGCFTVSSLGSIGGSFFTPIINAPEVAILGVSKASIKPVYDGNSFVPKLILPLSLSYDHRVINGADGAKFTTFLREILYDFVQLII